MKISKSTGILFVISFLCTITYAQIKTKNTLGTVTAGFTAPDTVCVNTPFSVQNTSAGSTNYYWSFCETNFTTNPDAFNLGNPNNQLSLPVFTDIVQDDNGDYYLFVVNNFPGQLVRMYFGNSLLNTPVVQNLGDFGGAIPQSAEGIQVVKVNGNWVVVIVGGDPAGGIISSIMKIDLGTSLASTTGIGTNWGNLGNLSYPHDLYLFTDNTNWYGYTVNARNNTITKFNFGTDFSTIPVATNLGDIGNLNGPVGIGAINNAGNWYLFLTNSTDGTITRLDFGNSLLNNPTATNIGNPGNSIDNPRDISFIRLCNSITALVVNGNSSTITKLDFSSGVLATPTATSIGNQGNLLFPHSISALFRVNSDIYAFVPNVNNNTLTRIHFAGCSTPGSNQQNPANIVYSQAGTYNINLLVDLGLPTQTSFCKQVVAKNCLNTLCTGSLGDPVVNITFGSGDNPGPSLPTLVPGASTTLNYVAVSGSPALPVPVDGQYTITNNIPANGSWFSGASDHTPNDVNGFMAFYISSEQPGEFYSQTVNNLCGSTTYEFAAWIANALNSAVVTGVSPNITFTIEQTDGTVLGTYNTGDIPQSNTFTWNQYGFFFTTPATVSTVVLKMTNANPGGTANTGNDFAVDDITFRACGPVTTASFSQTVMEDSIEICEGSSAGLYGKVSAGYTTPSYVWQLSQDSGKTWLDIPSSNALQLNITAGSVSHRIAYKYRLMTGEGINFNSVNCRVASNLITLVVNPQPLASITGGDICSGNQGQLTFNSSQGTGPFAISIKYNFGAGVNTFNGTGIGYITNINIPVTLTDTTTFTLASITDANGCETNSDTTATINVLPLPQGGIAAFNAVCAIDSAAISFVSTAGTAPFQLVISDGTNTTTYYGIMPGVPFKIAPMMTTTTISLLSVTDEDGNGCTRSAGFITPDALISVSASPVIVFDTVGNVCIDKSTFLIDQAKETSGLAGFGIFSGDGIDASGNFSAIQAGLGTHNITYTFAANNGCSAFKSQNITVVPDPVANAGNDLIDCMGVSVQLNASGGKNYLWTPADGLSNPAIPNPMVTASATTTYTVMVTDSNGCSASDSVTVVVSAVGKAIYVLPNAFTPNGDGKNDCFGVSHWGGINLLEFSIYNRWGQLVFATKNTSECWGGVYNGTMQDAGTYVYVVRATTPCGDINLRGTVILIR